jgi:hypothetical protein
MTFKNSFDIYTLAVNCASAICEVSNKDTLQQKQKSLSIVDKPWLTKYTSSLLNLILTRMAIH